MKDSQGKKLRGKEVSASSCARVCSTRGDENKRQRRSLPVVSSLGYGQDVKGKTQDCGKAMRFKG